MNHYISILIFVFLSPLLWAQTVITGNVLNEQGNAINQGFIVTSTSLNGDILEYTEIKNGTYELYLKKVYRDTIFVRTRVTSYKEKFAIVKKDSLKSTSITLNFTLEENKDTLDEVLIIRKLPEKIIVKKDTISYSAKQIADSDDRKLVDLIDNVPFLNYNEQTGVITYKNVAITTITINGKNIVDSNYGVIAKNLNIDMIDRLETIDNYSDNPITKAFQTDDKKSINILLNKNALQLTTALELQGVSFDSLKPGGGIALTTTVFNEIINSFNDLSLNNIGVNPTSLNPENVSDTFEKNYYGNTLKGLFDTSIGLQDSYGISQGTVNNNLNTSLNSVLSLNNITDLKINVDYFNDTFEIQKLNAISYLNTENTLNTSLFSEARLKPEFIDLRLNLQSRLTPKQLLKFYSVIDRNSKDIVNNAVRSDMEAFNILNKSTYSNINLGSEYSLSLKMNTALKIDANLNYEENESNFMSSPGFINPQSLTASNSSQQYLLKQLRYNVNSHYYYKKNKHSIVAGISHFLKDLNVNSLTQFTTANDLLANTINLTQSNFLASVNYGYELGKIKFTAAPRFVYFNQDLNSNDNTLSKNVTKLLPMLKVNYTLKNGLVFINGKRDVQQLKLDNAFQSPLLLDEFTLVRNIPSLDIITSDSVTLGLLLSGEDITSNNFQLFATYISSNALFLPQLAISEDIVLITNELQYLNNETLQVNAGYVQFLNELNMSVNVAPSFQYTFSPGRIDESTVSGIRSYNYGAKLELNSAFSGFFNFSSITEFNSSNSKFGESSFSNSRFTQFLKLRIRPTNKISTSITYNYFIPEIDQKYSIGFLGASINLDYFKDVKFSLIGRNLTNNIEIESIQIDAFSRSLSSQNVLPRYFGFRLEFDL